MTDQPPPGRQADPSPGLTSRRTQGRDTDRRPVLPRTSPDETDVGWGDIPDTSSGDDERILREVPPHHLG